MVTKKQNKYQTTVYFDKSLTFPEQSGQSELE